MLRGQPPISGRAAAQLPPVDLAVQRRDLAIALRRSVTEREVSSSLLFPALFHDYEQHRARFGDVSRLPTSAFLYGLQEREEIEVDVGFGKSHVIGLMARTGADPDGFVTLFFAVDGQLQLVRIASAAAKVPAARAQAEDGNPAHVGAALAGTVVAVAVRPGQRVARGEPLVAIEAMKMETHVIAERKATVTQVYVKVGDAVSPRDLLVLLNFAESATRNASF